MSLLWLLSLLVCAYHLFLVSLLAYSVAGVPVFLVSLLSCWRPCYCLRSCYCWHQFCVWVPHCWCRPCCCLLSRCCRRFCFCCNASLLMWAFLLLQVLFSCWRHYPLAGMVYCPPDIVGSLASFTVFQVVVGFLLLLARCHYILKKTHSSLSDCLTYIIRYISLLSDKNIVEYRIEEFKKYRTVRYHIRVSNS